MKNNSIGIIGLGKLGLPMLSAFIKRGFDVNGYDINQSLITKLRSRSNPYNEPGVSEIIISDEKWSDRFFNNIDEFLETSNFFFLIIPTPTLDETFDISYLKSSIQQISKCLRKLNKKATLIVTSTVNPGDCERISAEYLKDENISLVYSPEFIALGSVLKDMLHPEVVLLGGDDDDAIDQVFSIYSKLYESHPEYHRLSLVEAEIAKIAINTFVTTKISFANMIGTLVEKKTNSRNAAQKVLNAIGGDTRIGRKYFRYGASYGGPCFPRDNRALAAHLKAENVVYSIASATDETNEYILQSWIERITLNKYDAIVLIGVAYKDGTDFLEESFMLKIGSYFSGEIDVFYSDPLCIIDNWAKINDDNHHYLLKNKKKVLALTNYGNLDLSMFPQVEELDIWSK
jgi:UDPglucose 6-dehydrogenase